MTNEYCATLGIAVPELAKVKGHPEANTYTLLIVALVERGSPMTLVEIAERFEEAGVAAADRALASLKRCRPARPPVYRDGDHYALDLRDDQLDLLMFRLDLRPSKAPRLSVVRPEPPQPGPDEPLTVEELDVAWRDASLYTWSYQRLVLAVLDAHGDDMRPEDVVAFVSQRTWHHDLRAAAANFTRRGSPIDVKDDGRWAIVPEHRALTSAREAVRQRVATARKWAAMRPDPVVMEAHRIAWEQKAAAHAAELAALRRVLIHAFPAPPAAPEAIVLVDVSRRDLATYLQQDVVRAIERLRDFDVIGAVDVRRQLRVLGFDPEQRHLAELGPPQKTTRLNKQGRTLKITLPLLVQSSCNIARPFGDPEKLRDYLRSGKTTRFKRRLEADATSLFALYAYGRLHHAVRVRWGFLDDMLPIRWVHRDEPGLYHLKREAFAARLPVEAVIGTAPGWSDPWARARRFAVGRDSSGFRRWLVDADGVIVDDADVQAARLVSEND